MRRIAFVFAAALASAGLAIAPSMADSPHFLYADNTVSTSTGALTTSFKEAGLGTGTTSVSITLSVDSATASYQCFNKAGNKPQGVPKSAGPTSLLGSGQFPVRHGQTTASLTVGPVASPISCPPGQALFLEETTYSGIVVSDEFGNSIHATPDPISSGPIHVRVG
ncbi:hypothetical protein AB0I00_17695 [Streptomyces sp. NPDC050803]|uniref:hypothetical protein n=1 Tax=unclassified Streptomyces TaxID=2593676 RepID=UPI00342E423B